MDELRGHRIPLLRKSALEPDEKKLVDDIVELGCHIIHVRSENGIPGWSYTVGLVEMLNQPEMIVVGLKENLAHSVLNEIARRVRNGAQFKESHRESDLLDNVECEFKAVEQRWLRQTMGYAVWFYGGDEFPVMQCVYPDLENRFPWEEHFDSSWRQRQPLLFLSTDETIAERDFWAANDPDSSISNWKFPVPPHTGVYTTKRIMKGEEPVLAVYHDAEDGAWQFHGAGESSVETAALVCFHHIVDNDSTIIELADLPAGWCATRDHRSDPWVRQLDPPEPEDNLRG